MIKQNFLCIAISYLLKAEAFLNVTVITTKETFFRHESTSAFYSQNTTPNIYFAN